MAKPARPEALPAFTYVEPTVRRRSKSTSPARPVYRAPTLLPPQSPAPPKDAAKDSPAAWAESYARQLSDMSASSDSSAPDRRDVSPDTPVRPDSSGSERDHSPAQPCERPQRRPRSSDGEAAEEAKRHCADSPQPRVGARDDDGAPLSFAEAARISPTPGQQHTGTTTSTTLPLGGLKKKKTRYPPLVVKTLPDWQNHFKALTGLLGHPPHARPYRDGFRFIPEGEDEYRLIQRYLVNLEKTSAISWFAYSPPAERNHKLAIRGLPADTDPALIEEELRRIHLEPTYVRSIKARAGRPGCIFHAIVKRQPDLTIQTYYGTTTFLLMRGVVIEAWRGKRGTAQCHRCQGFRHSSHLCHRPLACVRCGEGHTARNCTRPRAEPATCANCAGPHPSSSRECPVFRAETTNKRAGTAAITRRAPKTPSTRDAPPANAEVYEAPSTSLMAAANGPSDPQPIRQKGRKRGRKRKKSPPPCTQPPQAELAPSTARSTKKPPPKNEAVAAANEAPPNSKPPAHRGDRTSNPTPEGATTSTAPAADAEINARAIRLLLDLLKAIRRGEDPQLTILEGLEALLALYSGTQRHTIT